MYVEGNWREVKGKIQPYFILYMYEIVKEQISKMDLHYNKNNDKKNFTKNWLKTPTMEK